MAKEPDYKKLESLFTRDAVKKIQASLAILISNYVDIWEDGYWTYSYGQPQAVKEIRASIAASIASLPEIIKYDDPQLNDYISRMSGHKKTIAAMEKTLQAYSFQLEFLSFYRRYCSGVAFYEQERPAVRNISRIVTDCMAYVVETGLGAAGNMRKAEVMSAFPVKMTRERYFDYVKESVLMVYRIGADVQAGDSASFIEQYVARSKFMFKPDASESYGAFFPEIAAKIDELNALEMDKMDAAALNQAGEKIDGLADELMILHDFLLLLFECANSLIMLSAFGSDFDYLFGDNYKFKDAYHTVAENIETEDRSLFYDKVSAIISEHLDSLMDGVPVLNEKCENLMKKLADFPGWKELVDIVRLRNTVTALFYENMTETAFKSDRQTEPVEAANGRERALSAATELTDFMKEALDGVPLKKQRLIKQFFLKRIFCPFDDDEFLEYLWDGFNSARDSAQVAVIASSVSGTLKRDGFGAGNEQDAEENL